MVRTPAQRKQLIIIMNTPVVYSYKGSEISFMSGKNTMINATQMAKPFSKVPKDWLRTNQTQEFITTLSTVRQICPTDLVVVEQGGNKVQGTWMQEDVALEFARWLSPAFAIWCNDRIKELFKTGVATISNDDEAIAYAIQVLIRRLKESRAKEERLQAENNLQSEELRLAAAKVQYVDNVLQSVNTYTSTQIAKELDMNAIKLHKLLKEKGVIFKRSAMWMLTAKYQNNGYAKTRTRQFTRNDGSIGTNTYTVWTEKGRAFIHILLDSIKDESVDSNK